VPSDIFYISGRKAREIFDMTSGEIENKNDFVLSDIDKDTKEYSPFFFMETGGGYILKRLDDSVEQGQDINFLKVTSDGVPDIRF